MFFDKKKAGNLKQPNNLVSEQPKQIMLMYVCVCVRGNCDVDVTFVVLDLFLFSGPGSLFVFREQNFTCIRVYIT